MAASANALYVLRLVIGGHGAATAAAAAAAGRSRISFSAAATAALAPYTPARGQSTAAAPPPSDFLEVEGAEYNNVETFLPQREEHAPAPIPWPTLFSHGDLGAANVANRPRACDLVARLVAENRLDPARKVHDELRALHTPILARRIYLSAALSSLAPTAEGRAAFLFWLGLYPNRPATPSTPLLKETWLPVVRRLLAEHPDPAFLADFLRIAGRKGLLPVVLPPMVPALITLTTPDVSERSIERAVAEYVAATTSRNSVSPRAQNWRNLVSNQVSRWWNIYLRGLALAGWDESAHALLLSPPDNVRFTRFTRGVVLDHGLVRKERAYAMHRAKTQADPDSAPEDKAAEPLASLVAAPAPGPMPLPQRIRRALDPNALPHVTELADLQRQLLAMNRASLVTRFRSRFIRRSGEGQPSPVVGEKWWVHAQVLRLSEDGAHEEAVQLWRTHFIWVGLPPSPVGAPASPSAAPPGAGAALPPSPLEPLLVPNIYQVTTLLRSLLALLPSDALAAYHTAYLAQAARLPRSLRPNPYTHLAFVRELAHREGPEAATAALHTIATRGFHAGEPAWNALLLSLAGRGRLDAAFGVLDSMARRGAISDDSALDADAARLPRPSARSYGGLIRLLVAHDRNDEAALVLKHFEEFAAAKTAAAERAPKTSGRPPRYPQNAEDTRQLAHG